MFINRINSQLLINRLQAEYYNPELMLLTDQLQKGGSGSLRAYVNDFFRDPYCYGFDQADKSSIEFNVPYVKGEDLQQFVVTEAKSWVEESSLRKHSKVALRKGDLIISVRGYIGHVAVFSHKVGLPSPNVLAIRPKNTLVDSYFLSAYLNTNTGHSLVRRYVSGSVQETITVEDIGNIQCFVPNLFTQKHIGDKVRQAESLRAWAKSVQQQAAELLPAYIREIQRYKAKSYRAKDIVSERLDSLFYHPDYIALERKMKAKGCNRLGLIAKQIKDSWNKKKAETFEYYEIGGLDITTGQVSSTKTQTVGAPSRAKTKVQQGDVLVSTVRPNRKNVGFIVDSVTESEMVATSGFSVLRFSSLAQAAFYHAWLRTDDATAQLMRWNSGSAYPAIDDDVPLNIIVPKFEQEFVDSWGQKLLDAQFAYVYARKLTEAAKTLVETLIEGQLTEQQLIQAQQALDDGDNSLDQAILSKLSSEGYAIDGATPLFSDIDELYRLLESAAHAEAEE
ncbi:restriction endonuclease subunit S [Vibrio alginolyticus]